ncbi:MAG: ligand-binding sensor domain-containing protein [Vicingaceae bacterium]
MRKNLLLIIALISFFKTFSQQYNFTNYSIQEGLIQSQIRAVCQDSSGYIWIGTLGGLSKFDGVNFENFSRNDGLLGNQISAIFTGNNGAVWLGAQGGVTVYNKGKFKNYVFKEELSQNFVLSIKEDEKGVIWFATDGGGLVYLENNEFNYLALSQEEDNNYIRNIAIDNQNNKWLATRNGVLLVTDNHLIKDTIPDVNATQLFVDTDNSIWCSTFGKGVFHLVKDTCVKLTKNSGLISNHIRGFTKRKDGSFWFVSKNGISKFNEGKVTNFTEKDGLTENNIKVVLEDFEGNLFFGSDGGGLIKFINEDFLSYTIEDGVGSNVVMSVIEDKDKNIWVSSYDEGVTKFGATEYTIYKEKDGLANNTVWCSLLALDNRIWFGTSDGLSVYDGEKFKNYRVEDGLNAKKIYAISEDAEGNIWVGTKDGLSVVDVKSDSIYDYSNALGIKRNIRFIYKEDNFTTWFCSSDGLTKFNLKDSTTKTYSVVDGLPDNSVMGIVKDKHSRLWIGTSDGLMVYKNDVFKTIRLPDNYASNNINFLNLDDFGNLWIGTNFGLYQLYINDKEHFVDNDFVRYSNLDGLKSLECNQNASFIDSDNYLWFGTNYGLMKHNLKHTSSSKTSPKVRIKDIRLFFEKKDLSKFSKTINPITNLPDNMVLQYKNNHLTFDFVGIYHTGPDKVKYRFKLAGFDEVWQPITQSKFVTYSNIPAGDFTFKLSATTDLKTWTKPVSFSFTIQPPFWFTWWFYVLCILVVVGAFWLILKLKERQQENKRSTQLIIDKSKMLKLEQQALNSSMNRHFIFNALNSIQYYINRQDKKSANKYLSSFAKLVRKNLDSSLVNEIYLDDEIERIGLYLKLEEMRFQNKFNYKINVDPKIEPQSIKIPSMLLQPFIENSIWHGILPRDRQGKIVVDVVKKENKLIITIVDDGVGIDVSIKEKQGKNQYHDSKGMDLTKGRIDLISKVSKKDCAIKGPYQIYNSTKEVAGTEVSIILTL